MQAMRSSRWSKLEQIKTQWNTYSQGWLFSPFWVLGLFGSLTSQNSKPASLGRAEWRVYGVQCLDGITEKPPLARGRKMSHLQCIPSSSLRVFVILKNCNELRLLENCGDKIFGMLVFDQFFLWAYGPLRALTGSTGPTGSGPYGPPTGPLRAYGLYGPAGPLRESEPSSDPEERSSNRERDQRAESAARDATSFAMKCQRSWKNIIIILLMEKILHQLIW